MASLQIMTTHIFFLHRTTMKFTAAVFALGASVVFASAGNPKNDYINQLISGATVVRGLEEQQNDQEEAYQVDITSYSVKFEKCQFVKSYDDDLAGDEDSETVLATQRFVIFRLCPNNSCSSCSYGYGEYMIDLETYLGATIQYQQTMQESMCNACAQCGNYGDDQVAGDDQAVGDDQGAQENEEQENAEEEGANRRLQDYYDVDVDCDTCYAECVKIENLEANGFVDASNFVECQLIYDPDDDGKASLYAGPMCASQGTKINIGVFTDQNCYVSDSSKTVDDYIVDENGYPMQVSHALLKPVYASSSCVSCKAPQNQNNDGNDDGNQAGVLEMCGQLYEASAKCEESHGFDRGYAAYNGYDNQEANEDIVCDFIDSISAGSYDEQGEIVVYGASSAYGGGATTTGGQKFALTFFVLGTIGLAMYAGTLHSKLTKGATSGLSTQGGGAMA